MGNNWLQGSTYLRYFDIQVLSILDDVVDVKKHVTNRVLFCNIQREKLHQAIVINLWRVQLQGDTLHIQKHKGGIISMVWGFVVEFTRQWWAFQGRWSFGTILSLYTQKLTSQPDTIGKLLHT